jgi:hypothetical protein
MAGGCVMLNVRVIEQPFASVMVQVYVPAHLPVAVPPVPPLGAHEYVYGAVPPEGTTVALPVHAPLHKTFTCDCVAVNAGGCVMLNVRVVVHPFASVTVTVYVPIHNAEAVAPVPPEGAHEYV